MTALMQTTQEIVVDSLSPRMKQIVKAYGITTLELNSVPVTVFQNQFHSDGRLIASNRLTMDAHYMVPGHDVKILPSALCLSEPLPAVVVFVAKEKGKEEYKGIQKVNNPKTGNEIFALENGHEWSNGHFVIHGSIPDIAKKDIRNLATDFLKKEGSIFSIDLSTDYKVTYKKGKKYEDVCCYKVNDDLMVECKYVDFIINNTRNNQILTFELVDNTFVIIRSKGVFIASVACCRVNASEYAPEPHKAPKQSKTGILYARHESAESVQTEPVQTVEMIEQQTENNQTETGENMKTIVQKLIEKLAFWFDYFGIKAEAITKSKQEITATDKEWNEAFHLIGWNEWKKTVTAEQSKEVLPATVPHGGAVPRPVRHDLCQ